MPTSEARTSLKAAVRRRIVSPPVGKRQNNHLTPSCRLGIKKLLRQAWTPWSQSELGQHPAAPGWGARPWVSAIVTCGRHYLPHTKWLKNHWISWHSRFNYDISKFSTTVIHFYFGNFGTSILLPKLILYLNFSSGLTDAAACSKLSRLGPAKKARKILFYFRNARNFTG